MMEIIQFYRSFGSSWAVRCVAVAWLLLLSATVNAANSHSKSEVSRVRPREQASAYTLVVGQPVELVQQPPRPGHGGAGRQPDAQAPVPQVPPQPSLPHVLPVQLGVQHIEL